MLARHPRMKIIPLHGREGVKKLETGGDREGEAPAEPHGARACWGDGSPGGSPSHFFHTVPFKGEISRSSSRPMSPLAELRPIDQSVITRAGRAPPGHAHPSAGNRGQRNGR